MNQEEDKKIITETMGNTTAYKKGDSSQSSAPQEEGPGSGSETSTKQNNGIESILGQGKFEDTYQAQDYYQDKINQSNEGQVIDAKHNAEADAASTKSANFIAKNAAQANENYVRNEYQANQTVDKSGWTGGYALDTQRQLDYLKNSIAADIYSQQELQKLGYKSNLEQAKMAAEQEKNQLAFQRYQAAQAEAIQKAQLTGYYIDPHISDMLTQFNAAQADLKSGRNTEKANKVIEYVQNYFNHMNDSKKEELGFEQKTPGVISIKGIETLAHIQTKSEEEYQKAMKEYQEAMKNKEDILIKNSIEKSKQTGDFIPYFTDDGKLAGYGNTIPTGGKEKEHLQNYFNEHEGALEQTAKGILKNISDQYAAQLEKNSDLSFEEFMNKNYNGVTVTTLLNNYANTNDSITIDGITISKEGDSWKIKGDKSIIDQGKQGDLDPIEKEQKEKDKLYDKYNYDKTKYYSNPNAVANKGADIDGSLYYTDDVDVKINGKKFDLIAGKLVKDSNGNISTVENDKITKFYKRINNNKAPEIGQVVVYNGDLYFYDQVNDWHGHDGLWWSKMENDESKVSDAIKEYMRDRK